LVEDALREILGRGFDVRVQLPAALDANSVPEPDVAVVQGSPRDFADRHPSTAALIVEVADSSLAYDRTHKLASYARNGIAEYWIVNLVDRRLEVYREPAGESYRVSLRFDVSEAIAPGICPARPIAVRDLLP
jgi:Uma2 family endonuclease